ncbi:MAG: hypothetical protein A2X56_01635 [Nitrospirae bacterium GWC2_57_13]|nr:MAG: hypothetical protein A2X56_01635 [Nitrospirae bacterium GWC2_57_13]OGW44110.1 MAG: hypothetical protein A2X57_07850 [Nitrospirae bacterium GWD2_57_8]
MPADLPLSRNGELTCVTCHDGSLSTSATVKTGIWVHGRDFLRHDKGSHPIGVDYESARLRRGRKTDLRPLALVDPRIRFFDGKVGCGSCHDPYSKIEKQLVKSDRRSELCFSCQTGASVDRWKPLAMPPHGFVKAATV